MYSAYLSFNYIATSYFINKWFDGVSTKEAITLAGEAMGFPYLIAAVLIPFIGFISDKLGKKPLTLMFSSLLGFIAFLLFITLDPSYGLLFYSLSISICIAVVWPSVTLVVPHQFLGVGLSITISSINLFTSIMPLIVNYVQNRFKYFELTLCFMLILTASGVYVAKLIWKEEKKKNNIMNVQLREDFSIELTNQEISSHSSV